MCNIRLAVHHPWCRADAVNHIQPKQHACMSVHFYILELAKHLSNCSSGGHEWVSSKCVVTICEHIEGLPCCVQAGEAGGFWGDGSPALESRLQRRRPVSDHPQRLSSHWHHLRPLRPRLVRVGLLDCNRMRPRVSWVKKTHIKNFYSHRCSDGNVNNLWVESWFSFNIEFRLQRGWERGSSGEGFDRIQS